MSGQSPGGQDNLAQASIRRRGVAGPSAGPALARLYDNPPRGPPPWAMAVPRSPWLPSPSGLRGDRTARPPQAKPVPEPPGRDGVAAPRREAALPPPNHQPAKVAKPPPNEDFCLGRQPLGYCSRWQARRMVSTTKKVKVRLVSAHLTASCRRYPQKVERAVAAAPPLGAGRRSNTGCFFLQPRPRKRSTKFFPSPGNAITEPSGRIQRARPPDRALQYEPDAPATRPSFPIPMAESRSVSRAVGLGTRPNPRLPQLDDLGFFRIRCPAWPGAALRRKLQSEPF